MRLKRKLVLLRKKRVLRLHIQMQVKIVKLIDNNNLNLWSKFSWSTFITFFYFSLCTGLKILLFRWCWFNVIHNKLQFTLSPKIWISLIGFHQEGERSSVKFWFILYVRSKSIVFFYFEREAKMYIFLGRRYHCGT